MHGVPVQVAASIPDARVAFALMMVGAMVTVGVKFAAWATDHTTRMIDEVSGLPRSAQPVQLVEHNGSPLGIASKAMFILHELKQHNVTKEMARAMIDESDLTEAEEEAKAKQKKTGHAAPHAAASK